MTATDPSGQRGLTCRALLLGTGLRTQEIERRDALATAPLTIHAGAGGFAVLYRFGAVVLFGLTRDEETEFRASLSSHILGRAEQIGPEDLEIVISPAGPDMVTADGTVHIRNPSPERLQVIADVAAKSLVLELYEMRVADVFERLEPVAMELQQTGRAGADSRELLRQTGDVLITQHNMVGRVEVVEKPEALWEHPELERLHARLSAEYELQDRDRALTRKLGLISDTAEALINLVHNKRSLRVEWYIVVLILVEIVLTLYEIFLRS